jgi:gas vesicle protein
LIGLLLCGIVPAVATLMIALRSSAT